MESTSELNGDGTTSVEASAQLQTPEEALSERERAIVLLGLLPERKSYTIYCSRTGVPIATLEFLQQAGRVPYLANWKEQTAYHPLFSLPQAQLLAWTRRNWNQLFRNYTVDSTTEVQRQQFQIAFMAILHSMGCLDQQIPALPSFDLVNVNMQRLLELAYWHNYLDSKRFKFPTYRINKLNCNGQLLNIGVYLDICESRRHDWETSKEARFEDAKLEAAQKAARAVAGSHYKAVSKKALWNWFLSCLQASNSKKYMLPEWMEWKEDSAKLWFANENQQLQFALDDVTSIEDVFITECTLGTTVSHAFQTQLEQIRTHISNHLKIFEIDWVATINTNTAKRVAADGSPIGSSAIGAQANEPPDPGAEPNINEFISRAKYLVAKAKYDVAIMQRAAWLAKYGQQTSDAQQTPEGDDNASS